MNFSKKIVLIGNSSWYFYNFRLPLLFDIRNNGFNLFLVAPKDEYTKILEKYGFKIYEWELNRKSINILRELKSIISLAKILRIIQPDLIHNFTIKPCIYGTFISKINQTKIVFNAITGLGHVFVSNSMPKKILRFFLIPIYKTIFNLKKNIMIFQNESDKIIFHNLGILKNSTTFIIPGSGVDIELFNSVNVKKISFQDPLQILFPARLIREKGIIELLIAFKSLLNEGFNINLILAGNIDKGNKSSLKLKEIKELKKIKNLKILGHVNNMRDLYDQCDIVILPSWREGLSKTLIEAGAMSKPVITTNVPGCKDIIDHGVNGILVPVNDPKSIELAIKFYAVNKNLSLKFGRNLRKKIEKIYDHKKINKLTIDKYKRYLN